VVDAWRSARRSEGGKEKAFHDDLPLPEQIKNKVARKPRLYGGLKRLPTNSNKILSRTKSQK